MRFRLFSLLLAFFFFGCGETPEPQPEPSEKTSYPESGPSKGSALILTLEGKATVNNPSNEKGSSAYLEQFLSPGDSLVTGPNSEVLLLLTNGTTLTVGPDTAFELESFSQANFKGGDAKVGTLEEEASASSVLIDLKVGDLVVDVKKLKKKSNFEITTPLGVAGIRGTSFRLLASAESTDLSVLTGQVDFVSQSEESFRIEAGKMILAPKGEEPKVSPLAEADKQTIRQTIDKASEKADEVDLATLSDRLGSASSSLDSSKEGDSAGFESENSALALKVKDGQRIVLLGNTLAERMQHHGWLETYAQLAMPEKKLTFRNHGFCGDKIDDRPRNRGFIDPHAYLQISKADVILAFFGANEAWDDQPGEYASKLTNWINETLAKKYNGQSAPVIVLFSPIAYENYGNPNLPDGKEQNERLKRITEATAKVAKDKKLQYVDLFTASQKLYQETQSSGGSSGDPSNRHSPLTINGIHLTSEGNDHIARIIHKALFDKDAPVKHSNLEQTRKAVLDKNWHWFNRYRAADGNNVWGGRSGLRFVDKQSNRDVLWHELDMIDVMTTNRDKVVHAAAMGKSVVADDSNVPPPIKVKSNVGGKSRSSNASKEGSLNYTKAQETADQMQLQEGLDINVFASEEQFPEIANPVQMAVDTKGRLWVAAWPTYPKWEPLKEMNDALVILPDENRDGVADKAITFAKVHNPTGFEFWNGGVIVASAPDLIYLKDTDGDDVADVRIRIMHGIDSADTHHAANNLIFGPDGHIYYQRGVFLVSNVETPWQGPQIHGNSAMYRFNPRTFEYSFHATNSPNPHGISFDYWGYHYATDGTGGRAYQIRPDGEGGFKMQSLLNKAVRPVPSSGILSSAHFPEENNGNFLICNTIGFLGIKQYDLSGDADGNRQGTAVQDLLVSRKDRNFRPTDLEIGDDGALYVSDWQNVIIGHMQSNVRDPNRDKTHGRVYRITANGRDLMKHVKIDGEPISTLLYHLKNPTNVIRHRARIELSERDTDEVIKETQKWLKQFDPNNKDHAHHLLEALWIHQQHNVVNKQLLDQLLGSPENHARIAAKTVAQFWAKKL